MYGKRLKESPVLKAISAVIIPTIIATIIATVITNVSSTVIASKIERKNLLTSIQNLYIGSNKDWIDSKLGQATFIHTINDDYFVCVYAVDVAIVQVFYDTSASSCQAFSVTAYNLKPSEKIKLPQMYSQVVSEKSLGEFSFYEIDLSPDKVCGFTSTGPGRAFYGEQYNFYQHIGQGYNFYFMTMDYGVMESFTEFSNELDSFGIEEYIDDEVSLDQTMGQYITNRKAFYPNTYGVSKIYGLYGEEDVFYWFSDYSWFDSLQLRTYIGNDYS